MDSPGSAAKVYQARSRSRMASAKSRSSRGSSIPSPAFAIMSRTTSAPHSSTAAWMYQTFPFDFDIFCPPRRT